MANINVVIHTDSCVSRTGHVGAFQYWLGTTLTLWLDKPAGGVWPQLQPATLNLLATVLSPWRWTRADWRLCTDRADDAAVSASPAAPGAAQPQPIVVDDLSSALDKQLKNRLGNFDWLAIPRAGPADDPPWALRLMHLARTPAPIPHTLGLAIVHPLPGPPGPGDTPAAGIAAITVPQVGAGPPVAAVLQLGQPFPIAPDTITLTSSDSQAHPFVMGSPSTADMDRQVGLVMGLSRLTDTTGETARNWLGDLGPKLGRALHPWMRLADLVSGDYGAGTWTEAGVEAAAQRALTSLFADLTAPTSRTLALMAQLNPFNPSAVEGRFIKDWANRLNAGIPPDVPSLATLLGQWSTDLLKGVATTKWAARLYGAYATADHYAAMKALLSATQPDPAAFGAGAPAARVLVANVDAWLANPRNLESLFANLAPTRTAGAFFGALAQAAGSSKEDLVPIRAAFPVQFRTQLNRVIGPLETTDPVIESLGLTLWAPLFEGAPVLEPAAESGLALRADAVFLHDADKAVDPHRLHDGYVLAVRRTKAGLTAAATTAATTIDQLVGLLQPGDWEPPSICTRADLSAKGNSTVWPSLITPLPVSFDRASQVDPSQSEIRNAIVTYYGDPLIPANKPDPSATPDTFKAPPPEVSLLYKAPSTGGDTPKLAFGQVYQARCAYLAPGGISPQGWGLANAPWDVSNLPSTFGAVDTGMIDATTHLPITTSPKAFTLLRRLPPGPPRILSSPDEADAARLAELFSGPDDTQVRPLWRERMRTWHEVDRARLQAVSTCFLDAVQRRAPQSVTFYVRAPALPLGDNAQGSLAARVWRYWTQRDADGPAADPAAQNARKRLKTVFDAAAADGDLHLDDPAVIYPPRSSGATGGCFASLLNLEAGGVSLKKQLAVRFDEAQPFVKVVVSRDSGALAAGMVMANSGGERVLQVTAPPSGLLALSFQTFVDPGFLGGGADPRFSTLMLSPTSASQWATPTPPAPIDGVVGFGFAESLVAFESLPLDDHLPSPLSLWNAISLSTAGAEVTADFIPQPGAPAFDYVGKVTAWRQTWSWDGGPVDGALVNAAFQASPEGPASSGRGQAFVRFENDLFSGRGQAGARSEANHEANATTTRLFSMVRPANVGADYMRVRIAAESRYAALRATPPALQAKTVVEADAAGAGRVSDKWRAIALPLRRVEPLSTLKPRVAVPLFAAVDGSENVTGGFAVLLDEAAFEVTRGAGLAEQIVAEIVVEQLGVRVDDAGHTNPGVTLALAVGMDPTLEGGDGDPYGGAGGPVRVSQHSGGIGSVKFALATVLGETLEPESAAPMMPYATAIFEPTMGTAGALVQPGTMALIRLRVEALPAPVSTTRSPIEGAALPDVASPWSAPLWIQFLPQAPSDAFSDPTASLSQGRLAVTIKANPKSTAGSALFKRWRNLPARPTSGPGPEGRLGAVAGVVVRDATNREVLRPRCYMDARVMAADELTLTAKVTDFGAWSIGSQALFVQLLETQEFAEPTTAPAQASTDLAARAAQWMNDGGGDALGRIVGLGPRFFFNPTQS